MIPKEDLHTPTAYRAMGKALRGLTEVELQALINGGDTEEARMAFYRAAFFASAFDRNDCPTYVLGHSVAAALTATKAPSKVFECCPYSAFIVEAPSEFLPFAFDDRPKRARHFVSVLRTETMSSIALHKQGIESLTHLTGLKHAEDREPFDHIFREAGLPHAQNARDLLFDARLAVRLVLNTIAYVTTYRESVARRKGTSLDIRLLDVNCPREVQIDKAFRDQVIALVGARTIPRARGVLAHLVRGHWKRVGANKQLALIAAYRRGDEKIGRAVERTERIQNAP